MIACWFATAARPAGTALAARRRSRGHPRATGSARTARPLAERAAAQLHHDHPPAQLHDAALFMRQHLQSWGGGSGRHPWIINDEQQPGTHGCRPPPPPNAEQQPGAHGCRPPPPSIGPQSHLPTSPHGRRTPASLPDSALSGRYSNRLPLHVSCRGVSSGLEQRPEDLSRRTRDRGSDRGKVIGLKIREEKKRRSDP